MCVDPMFQLANLIAAIFYEFQMFRRCLRNPKGKRVEDLSSCHIWISFGEKQNHNLSNLFDLPFLHTTPLTLGIMTQVLEIPLGCPVGS